MLAAKQALRLEKEVHKLDRFTASIVDDSGYLQQRRAEMAVLVTFLAERYERKRVLISSARGFSPGDRLFQDPRTTAAALDRRVPHAIRLEMTGPRFRTEPAKERQPHSPRIERDTQTAIDTPSHHRAPETVTESGGHSADVNVELSLMVQSN